MMLSTYATNDPAAEPRPAPTEAAVSDDALLLQFEADVAVDAGRHLVLAKRRAASSELAMLDRAEELVARLQAERDRCANSTRDQRSMPTSEAEAVRIASRDAAVARELA